MHRFSSAALELAGMAPVPGLAYGAGAGDSAAGTVFAARSKIRSDVKRRTSPDDFARGEPQDIVTFPVHRALPYCWDFERKRLLLTLHADPVAVLNEPFVYAGQRKHTEILASVAEASLDDLFGARDPAAAPIFVFSPGRTGSTLFHSLLNCATPRAISEPDTLAQIAGARKQLRKGADEERLLHLIWHSVSPLFRLEVAGSSEHVLAVKLRSRVNLIIADMLRAFPKAKYVFMLRERRAWAQSVQRVFGTSPEQAADRLRVSLQALATLRSSGAASAVVHYEEVLSDPKAVLSRVLGQPLSPAMEEAVEAAMQRDSQAGSRVSRERETRYDETEAAAWMEAFEASWLRNRPAAAIEAVGLDF